MSVSCPVVTRMKVVGILISLNDDVELIDLHHAHRVIRRPIREESPDCLIVSKEISLQDRVVRYRDYILNPRHPERQCTEEYSYVVYEEQP